MPMSLSAADWTRNQRRKAGNSYVANAQKSPDVLQIAPNVGPYGRALGLPRAVGGSKTRRTAEEFTNYVASQRADFVLYSQGSGVANETGGTTGAMKRTLTRVCSCTTTALLPKVAGCSVCAAPQHARLG